MGGPSKQDKTQEQQDSAAQAKIGQEYADMAKSELQKQNQLQQPSIDYLTGIINAGNSGDYSKLITAAGAPISNITQQAQQSKEQIYNNIPAGAGRDAALAQTRTATGNNVASTLNQVYLSAFPQLAGLGTQAGQTGLQETGASLRGYEGSANTTNNVMQADSQSKASTMSFLGALAGAGGSALGGTDLTKVF